MGASHPPCLWEHPYIVPLAKSLSWDGDNSLGIQSIILSSAWPRGMKDPHAHEYSIKAFMIRGLIVSFDPVALILLLWRDG